MLHEHPQRIPGEPKSNAFSKSKRTCGHTGQDLMPVLGTPVRIKSWSCVSLHFKSYQFNFLKLFWVFVLIAGFMCHQWVNLSSRSRFDSSVPLYCAAWVNAKGGAAAVKSYELMRLAKTETCAHNVSSCNGDLQYKGMEHQNVCFTLKLFTWSFYC